MPTENSHATVMKVLRMIEILSSSRKYNKQEIIDKLELSDRSFYRYIGTLRDFGFVINNCNNFYFIEKNTKKFKEISSLLHFSDEESYILNEAIHSIVASTKLKENLISKLSALYDSDRIAVRFIGKEKSSKIKPILDAIREKQVIKIVNYSSSGSGKISDRIIEPFEFTPNYISLWAYEPKSNKNKLYKVDRMQHVELLKENWIFKSEHKASLLDCFRVGGKKKIPISFDMTLKARNLLVEEYPLSEQFITSKSENLYIFDGWVSTFDGIGRFVLGLTGEINNIKPNDFQTFIRNKLNFWKDF